MLETPTRRGLITGLGAFFIAAPAIVRASSLMPVSAANLGPPSTSWALKTPEQIIEDVQWMQKVFRYAVQRNPDDDGSWLIELMPS